MNGKPKLVLKLPKALQADSQASQPQSAKPQKKRKQPDGESVVQARPDKPVAAQQQSQGSVPTVKKKFKVLGPGSLKPSSSGFGTSSGAETFKPRISVKFGAGGKPSVSISGGPSSAPPQKHAAPAAPSGAARDTPKAPVRESPRGRPAVVEPRPPAAQAGPEKAFGKKKKKFKRLDQANGTAGPAIKVALPVVSLQSGAAAAPAKAVAKDAAQPSAAPSASAAEAPANGALPASGSGQAPSAELQKQPVAPARAAPPKRVVPSGPPEQLQVQRVIQRMQKKDPYKIFAEVPSEEMAPGYSKIVTRPMAFSIMWDRFHKGEYMTWEELQADLNQMFRNAMTYNRPETVFHKQAAKMLQLGAKVLDSVRIGARLVPKAKAAAPAARPPRDASQQDKQPEQEKKLVSEPRVLRPQRRPAKAPTAAKTARKAAAATYKPKAGVRAATAAALSAAEDNLPRETYPSRATRVLGCHQWKGLALGSSAEDVPFSSGRPLARPATGALPSGEQYAASLERFATGLNGPLLQKVLERKAQALKAPTAPPAPPPQQQQQQQKPGPMQNTGNRNVVPSSGGVPIANAPRPAWQNVPLYIQGASASLPQHANIHAHLAASASQTLPQAGQPTLQSRAASAPVQPNLNLNFQIAGLFGQNQQPQPHVMAALQKQAEALMAQHQRNTIAAAAAAAGQSRPGSAQSSGQPVLAGQPMGQVGQSSAPPGSQQPAAAFGLQGQQANSQPITQQLLQQQITQLTQLNRSQAAPAVPQQQNRPP